MKLIKTKKIEEKDILRLSLQSKKIKELLLCFTQQGLNRIPWGLDLSEFLMLEKIK